MATKVKCPKCGAKNTLDQARCRVCTAMINPNAAGAGSAAPPAPRPAAGMDDHFDASVIDRQLQPARGRFDGAKSGGGLSARIAAANGGTIPPSVFGSGQTPAGSAARGSATPSGAPPAGASSGSAPEPFGAPAADAFSAPAPPPRSSASDDFEPFDADALFRDMGSPG